MSAGSYATGALAGGASGAGVGALAGPYGAIVGGVVGAGIGLFGASQQGDSSEAYQQMAQAQLDAQRQNRDLALGYAAPSMEELQNMQAQFANMQRMYAYQQASHARDSQILESQYPGIIAASQNLHDLMTGKDAAILGPLRQQQQLQRQQMQAQLQRQLGPGWQTSSAGIEAMTRFDQNADMAQAQAQLQATQTVSGAANALTGDYQQVRGNDNQDSMAMGQLQSFYGQGMNSISNRRVAAATGTNLAPYAGAGSVGQYMTGQYGAKSAANMIDVGARLAGSQFGSGLNPSSGSGKSWGGFDFGGDNTGGYQMSGKGLGSGSASALLGAPTWGTNGPPVFRP